MWALIWTFIATIIYPLLKIILKALGIGGVAFLGLTTLLTAIKTEMQAQLSGLPIDILQIMDIAGFFQFISMIFSAYSIRLILGGVKDDIKRVWSRSGEGSVF